MQAHRPPVLVLACGALANEILAVCQLNRWTHFDLQCLPAHWHNRPEHIAPGVKKRLAELAPLYERVLVGYGDCGTSGKLDQVLAELVAEGLDVQRLPGAHCYEFFAGSGAYESYQEQEIGTFYLTDFLLRHFDNLVIKGLGIDRHPQLLDLYFGHYKRLMYLAQVVTDERVQEAGEAAKRLGLALEVQVTGYGDLEATMHNLPKPNLEKVIAWQS